MNFLLWPALNYQGCDRAPSSCGGQSCCDAPTGDDNPQLVGVASVGMLKYSTLSLVINVSCVSMLRSASSILPSTLPFYEARKGLNFFAVSLATCQAALWPRLLHMNTTSTGAV